MGTRRLPLSTLIITLNEERSIERCLSSVAWSDEIVVVDGGSTDRTKAIATNPAAPWFQKLKWLERAWSGFREQRNFSLAQASHDWVLVLDSDEACTPDLAWRLKELLSIPGGPPLHAYKVRRQEYFLGKPIHHGIWNPSYQDRFFHKAGVQYVNEIHEYPSFIVPGTLNTASGGTLGRIEEPIDHDPGFDPERFLSKMNRYTTIEAQDRVRAGLRTNPVRLFFAMPAMFLKNYFYYRAWKDGMHGFVISLLEGLSRVVRHVKIWRFQREAAKNNPS